VYGEQKTKKKVFQPIQGPIGLEQIIGRQAIEIDFFKEVRQFDTS
jgi:hypothetical protein